MLLTGVFADSNINAALINKGLIFGETKLISVHVIALFAVSIFSYFGSLLLLSHH